MSSLPHIAGTVNIPVKEPKPAQPRSAGRRGPGRYWLHGGERSEFARRVLEGLEPGKAAVLEFSDPAELALWRTVLLNVNRCTKTHAHVPVKTKVQGGRLLVWLKDEQQMRLL